MQRPSITEGFVGTFRQEDLPDIVNRLRTRSLMTLDQNGTPQGDLIEKWTVNKEATLYTFILKDSQYWSDGTKVKAQDVEVTLPDVTTTVVDEKTIEFRVVEAFSPFPSLLTKPIFKKDTEIGTGPYQVDQIKKDQIFVKKMIFKPVNKEDKSLPEITIKFYPSEKIAKNALKLGEIQALYGVTGMDEFKGNDIVTSVSRPNYRQLVTIFYNTTDPILSDENFRLALSYAAPSIPGEIEALTPIPPVSWAFNKSVKDYLDNDEQAKASLKKVQKGKDETIVLTATTSLRGVGEQVVNEWNNMGIKSVLRIESGIPQNFQALLIAQNIPADPDQYTLWHSKGPTNISQYSFVRVDKDLEDGRKAADIETRKAKYDDFQKILLDHSPATFLYFPKYNIIYMKKIESQLKKVIDMQVKSFY